MLNSWVEKVSQCLCRSILPSVPSGSFWICSHIQSGLIVAKYWLMLAPSNVMTLFQKSYSKGFNIRFRTEEESEAFHCTFEQLKKEGSIKGAAFWWCDNCIFWYVMELDPCFILLSSYISSNKFHYTWKECFWACHFHVCSFNLHLDVLKPLMELVCGGQ